MISGPHSRRRVTDLVSRIREFMRDFPQLNRLIDGQESTDRQIMWAIMDAIELWNAAPPFLDPVSLADLPPFAIMRDGILAYLLESLVLLQNRNQIQFSDGGISVQIAPERLNSSLAQMYRQRFEQARDRYKASQNIERAMDPSDTNTEYYYINYGANYGVW